MYMQWTEWDDVEERLFGRDESDENSEESACFCGLCASEEALSAVVSASTVEGRDLGASSAECPILGSSVVMQFLSVLVVTAGVV